MLKKIFISFLVFLLALFLLANLDRKIQVIVIILLCLILLYFLYKLVKHLYCLIKEKQKVKTLNVSSSFTCSYPHIYISEANHKVYVFYKNNTLYSIYDFNDYIETKSYINHESVVVSNTTTTKTSWDLVGGMAYDGYAISSNGLPASIFPRKTKTKQETINRPDKMCVEMKLEFCFKNGTLIYNCIEKPILLSSNEYIKALSSYNKLIELFRKIENNKFI